MPCSKSVKWIWPVQVSSEKQSDPGNFLISWFIIFRCQKYVKIRVHRNDKKNLPSDF